MSNSDFFDIDELERESDHPAKKSESSTQTSERGREEPERRQAIEEGVRTQFGFGSFITRHTFWARRVPFSGLQNQVTELPCKTPEGCTIGVRNRALSNLELVETLIDTKHAWEHLSEYASMICNYEKVMLREWELDTTLTHFVIEGFEWFNAARERRENPTSTVLSRWTEAIKNKTTRRHFGAREVPYAEVAPYDSKGGHIGRYRISKYDKDKQIFLDEKHHEPYLIEA